MFARHSFRKWRRPVVRLQSDTFECGQVCLNGLHAMMGRGLEEDASSNRPSARSLSSLNSGGYKIVCDPRSEKPAEAGFSEIGALHKLMQQRGPPNPLLFLQKSSSHCRARQVHPARVAILVNQVAFRRAE